jgi:hypothetical protein
VTLLLILTMQHQSNGQKADDLICASCTAKNLARYNQKTTCQCSVVDVRIKNHVVCLRDFRKLVNCGVQLGYCCENNNDVCPLCSESFTRNSECSCETLDLVRKVIKKNVTKKDAADVYCCDETKPVPKTTEPPPVLRRIRPSRIFKFKFGIED